MACGRPFGVYPASDADWGPADIGANGPFSGWELPWPDIIPGPEEDTAVVADNVLPDVHKVLAPLVGEDDPVLPHWDETITSQSAASPYPSPVPPSVMVLTDPTPTPPPTQEPIHLVLPPLPPLPQQPPSPHQQQLPPSPSPPSCVPLQLPPSSPSPPPPPPPSPAQPEPWWTKVTGLVLRRESSRAPKPRVPFDPPAPAPAPSSRRRRKQQKEQKKEQKQQEQKQQTQHTRNKEQHAQQLVPQPQPKRKPRTGTKKRPFTHMSVFGRLQIDQTVPVVTENPLWSPSADVVRKVVATWQAQHDPRRFVCRMMPLLYKERTVFETLHGLPAVRLRRDQITVKVKDPRYLVLRLEAMALDGLTDLFQLVPHLRFEMGDGVTQETWASSVCFRCHIHNRDDRVHNANVDIELSVENVCTYRLCPHGHSRLVFVRCWNGSTLLSHTLFFVVWYTHECMFSARTLESWRRKTQGADAPSAGTKKRARTQ